MFQKIIGALALPEVRRRIGITLAGILAFRIGCLVPTPGVDAAAMAKLVAESGGPLLGFFNLFSGGALERCSVFALGVQPYINASIIMQLLVFVVPRLEHMQKEEGKEGREQLERWTRYGALVIGALQAFGVCLLLEQWSARSAGAPLVAAPGWGFRALAVATLTAGSALVMWLGKKMTDHGMGNGMSMLITAGIVARLPSAALIVAHAFELDRFHPAGFLKLAALAAVLVAVTALVVTVHDGVRKIPVEHSRRVMGRRLAGGGSSNIPLKVNQGGVMPIIFASSLLMLPGMVLPVDPGHPAYLVAELALIVFFAYFYAGLQMDPKELALALRKQGAFTPGVRAGKPTAEFIDRVLARVTLAGGVFLAAIALVPHALGSLFGGTLAQVHFGGTSLLIVVGATLETVRQLEAHAATRDYQRLITL